MKSIKGDLLSIKSGIIAHGCNRSMGFGSGVALAIKNKYPVVRECFMLENPGSIRPIWVNKDLAVINCYTQESYGRIPGKVYASEEAILKSLSEVANFAKIGSQKQINIPKIGCGLGGLNWEDVKLILLAIELKYNVEFMVYEL